MQRKLINSAIKSVIVVGAGPAGLFAAKKLQHNHIQVTILEKTNNIGGKCCTYTDNKNGIKTEWGAALIAPNYGKVIDAVVKNDVNWERVLPTDMSNLPLTQYMKNAMVCSKFNFAIKFLAQMKLFNYHAKHYQSLTKNKLDLPDDYKLSFQQFAEAHGLELINEFSKLFVPAFGYGLMEECPAYAVFQYYGLTTILDVVASELVLRKPPLLSIQNGFQYLMEKVAEKLDVKTNVAIQSIERNEFGVVVSYNVNNGDEKSASTTTKIKADALVIATSPVQWSKFGMPLTETEAQCVKEVKYYEYPVAVVKLNGFPAHHYFEYKNLSKEGLGHLALITTRDNRINPFDGRLCTAYINLPENVKGFAFTADVVKQLKTELLQVPGVTSVDLLETKVWEDYMPTLSWQKRLQLDKEQMSLKTNTLYVGASTLGGFEDVACVIEQSTQAVDRHILKKPASNDQTFYKNAQRVKQFFFRPPVEPANDATINAENKQADKKININ